MKSKTEVPVLMVFFNRPEPLKQVFDAVRKAQPKQLFLAQDGAREGNANDVENIKKCREVVENIDWDCEVRYNYSDKNLGCGGRMSSAITWAFESVDRLMILEDDCVPGESFFPFCEELLERYKDDYRISMISAMNHLEVYNNFNNDSYIFCNSGAIWGWATWKREWEKFDYNLEFVDKYNVFDKILKSSYPSYYKRALVERGKKKVLEVKSGKKQTAWAYQYNMIRFLEHQLTIVPMVNMVSNVGLSGDSTHSSGDIKLIPRGLRSVFFMKCHKLEMPMRHPGCMYCDDEFDRRVWRLMGQPAHIKIWRKIESAFLRIVYGNRSVRTNLFKKMIKK